MLDGAVDSQQLRVAPGDAEDVRPAGHVDLEVVIRDAAAEHLDARLLAGPDAGNDRVDVHLPDPLSAPELSYFCIDFRHADRDHRLLWPDRHSTRRGARRGRPRRSLRLVRHDPAGAGRGPWDIEAGTIDGSLQDVARSCTSPARASASAGATTSAQAYSTRGSKGRGWWPRPPPGCRAARSSSAHPRPGTTGTAATRSSTRTRCPARGSSPRSSRRGRLRPSRREPPGCERRTCARGSSSRRTVERSSGCCRLSSSGRADASEAAASGGAGSRSTTPSPPISSRSAAARGPGQRGRARRRHEPGVRQGSRPRPAPAGDLPAARPAVKAAFGQMGEEMLLARPARRADEAQGRRLRVRRARHRLGPRQRPRRLSVVAVPSRA